MKALFTLFALSILAACHTNRPPAVSAPADEAEYYLPNQPMYALQKRILPDPHGGLGHSQDPDIRVTDIQLTGSYTVVYMTYAKDRNERNSGYFASGTSEISFNPKATLVSRDGKHTYKLIKTTGIPMTPETREIRNDEAVPFVLYFERLYQGVESFDLFECKSDNQNSCFNVEGLNIENPSDAASSKLK